MRVVYIQNANLPTEWAHGYQIVKTCDALAQAGVTVQLVIPKRKNPNKNRDLFAYYKMEPTFAVRWISVIDLVPYVPFALEKMPYVFERWLFLRGLRNLPGLGEADVWFTRDPRIAQELLSFPNAKPIVLELHDDPRTSMKRWESIKGKIAAYVVISQGLKMLLQSEGIPAEKILVAPDGFDAREFSQLMPKKEARERLNIEPSTQLMIYVGQLFPWKGMDELAPVFDRIPEGMTLVIVGGQKEDIERLKKLAPGNATRVKFIGQVPHADTLTWFAAADAGVLPTSAKYTIGKLFTSPLKLFEYLAAGLPVIASDVPSSHEVLDETCGFFFLPDSGTDFVRASHCFAKMTQADRQRMMMVARKRAQGFSWEERGQAIATFLQTVSSFARANMP